MLIPSPLVLSVGAVIFAVPLAINWYISRPRTLALPLAAAKLPPDQSERKETGIREAA